MAGQGGDALSVSLAVRAAKGQMEAMPTMTVVGEVSGFRGPNARSGHCYFALKDAECAMDAIVWRGVYEKAGFELRDGLEVQVRGKFDVYERSGKLSFVARSLTIAGEGLLRQKVAELARRLEAEGLMDAGLKRPVPAFCERIAVVTSLSGSVIDDVKRTLARRNPLVAIDVVGCAVQGDHAPATIVRALSAAASTWPDAILLVRGGGSFEDLMAFNDESVARAIAACPVPVVTGIGHEPDTSIADMVADRRCSTPTAAAESVAPALSEVVAAINHRSERLVGSMARLCYDEGSAVDAASSRMALAVGAQLARERARVEALGASGTLTSPWRIVQARRESLELSSERLASSIDGLMGRFGDALERESMRLMGAGPRICAPFSAAAEALAARLGAGASTIVRPRDAETRRLAASLEALSPLKVLGRGYAIAQTEDGHVVDSCRKAEPGMALRLRVQDGAVLATVTGTEPLS